MDKKTLIAVLVSAAVTAVVGIVIASAAGVFSRGSEALSEDQIRKVLTEVMVTQINGETKTYGEALSLLSTNMAVVDSRLGTMEKALIALSED